MKKYLFILLALIGLTASAQITIIRPIPGRVVYPSAPTLLRTVNVKLDLAGNTGSIPNWNWWAENSSQILNTSTGTATNFRLASSGSAWLRETSAPTTAPSDYPLAVFDYCVFTYAGYGNNHILTLTGLDPTKNYVIGMASSFKNSDPSAVQTDVTINGVTKQLLNTVGNQVYSQEFTVNNPASGTVVIYAGPSVGASYGLVSAMVIKEYSTGTAQTKIGYYGDSITENYSLSYSDSYVSKLSSLLGLTPTKNAENGRTLQKASGVTNSLENVLLTPTSQQLIDYPVIPYSSDFGYLIIRIGANDPKLSESETVTNTTFTNSLKNVVNYCISQGWPASKICLVNVAYNDQLVYSNQIQFFNDFNTIIGQVASNKGTKYADLNGYYNTRGTHADATNDGLHPNSLGSTLDAQFIYNVLTQ